MDVLFYPFDRKGQFRQFKGGLVSADCWWLLFGYSLVCQTLVQGFSTIVVRPTLSDCALKVMHFLLCQMVAVCSLLTYC